MRAVPAGSLLIGLALALLLIAGGAGCGGSGGPVTDAALDAAADGDQPNGDAEDDGDSGAGGDDGALLPEGGSDVPPGECNSLQPGTAFIQPTNDGATTPPPAEGGTLVSGRYHLVSTTYYPSRICARDAVATTLVVNAASPTAGTLELATGIAGGSAFTESTRYASAGTLLSTHIECFSNDPGGVQGAALIIPYTATATEVRLFTNIPGCGFSVDSYQM